MICNRCQEMLWQYQSGDLSVEEYDQVREHVSECDACAGQRKALRRLKSAVISLPQIEPSRELCLKVKAAVREGASTHSQTVNTDPIMDIEGLAHYLKVDVEDIHENMGQLPCFEFAGEIRFRRESIDEWVEIREREQRRMALADQLRVG